MRHIQERLIGAPILQRLKADHGEDETEQRLLALLDGWRGWPGAEQGYGPGNLVNLLRLLRGHLRGRDLSRLVIRQGYLAEVDAQDASFVDTHLADTVLAEAFDFPGSLALSSDGALLAAGTSNGAVWLWRVADRTPLATLEGHAGGVFGVSLSADGQLVASASEDGALRLWETSTGRPLPTLQGHRWVESVLAEPPADDVVIVGIDERSAVLWNGQTWTAHGPGAVTVITGREKNGRQAGRIRRATRYPLTAPAVRPEMIRR